MKRIIYGSVLALAALFMVGCSTPATTVAVLESVTIAAELAVTELSTGQVIDPQAKAYLDAILAAVSTTTEELSTTDLPSEKTQKIASYFALVQLPDLLHASDKTRARIAAVDASVKIFLVLLDSQNQTASNLLSSGAVTPKELRQVVGQTNTSKLKKIKGKSDKLRAGLSD